MRIEAIHIDRYGTFYDEHLSLTSARIQVIAGHNEAGKSTLKQFIHDIFLVFRKNHSPGYTVEGMTFGGRLVCRLTDTERLTIERLGNKGKGRLRIYDQKGKQLDIDHMQQLLPGLDEKTYERIFSFGIDGLNQVDKLSGEDLNNHLFQAGMTGGFAVNELEQSLFKKHDALYSKQARKKPIPQLLKQVEDQKARLNEWDNQLQRYETLNASIDDGNQQLADLAEQKARLHAEKAIAPHVFDKQKAEAQLQTLITYDPFPEDGLAQFDRNEEYIKSRLPEKEDLTAKRQAYVDQLETITIHTPYMSKKSDVQHLQEQWPVIKERQQTLQAKNRQPMMLRLLCKTLICGLMTGGMMKPSNKQIQR